MFGSFFRQKFDVTYTRLTLKERFWLWIGSVTCIVFVIYLFGKLILAGVIVLGVIGSVLFLAYRALTKEYVSKDEKRLDLSGIFLFASIVVCLLFTLDVHTIAQTNCVALVPGEKTQVTLASYPTGHNISGTVDVISPLQTSVSWSYLVGTMLPKTKPGEIYTTPVVIVVTSQRGGKICF